MSDYLDYLKESTNTVKSHDKLSKLLLVLAYLLIWAIAIIAFWFFTEPDQAMGYGVMYLWIVLPVTTFIVSFIVGKRNYFNQYKYIGCILLGIMYMLSEYATFSAANMNTFNHINMPDFSMILIGAFISLAGMIIGQLFHKMKKD